MTTPTVLVRRAHRKDPRPAGGTMRTDIQGLRAIAVSLVLLYHLWPNVLTGGFAGVDVFFAISGFLITSHLLAHPPRGPRDLAEFWSRRIRRLLPASLLVLASTAVASRLFAPDTQWANTASQVKASALYVVNWLLASDSVDYLAAENAPSPVQHFWSLSVEEQFYFVWPVLILALVAVATRRGRNLAAVVFAGLAAVVLLSLAYSVHATSTEPASAYFVTPTRIWELGLGGLLAVVVSRRAFGRHGGDEAVTASPAIRVLLAWVGLAAVVYVALTYTGSTPFPGWQAGVPVLGTVLVIAGNAPRAPWSPASALALRPVQWLGGVSYSVYLWHWPMIVLLPSVLGHRLGVYDKLAVVLATFVLAALTKRFVEDRFRTTGWGRPLWKPFVLAAAGMSIVVGLSVAQGAEVEHRESVARTDLRQALAAGGPCFGAAALGPGAATCPATTRSPVLPAPAQAARDKSDAYGDVSGGKDCWSYLPRFPTKTCVFGDKDAPVSIALVGNSHAGQWLPALQRIATSQDWKITTFLASRCAMASTAQVLDTRAQTTSCQAWGRRTSQRIASGGFDEIVMTNRISAPAAGVPRAGTATAYARGYADVLRRWQQAGIPVVAIHDTPFPGATAGAVPDCLASNPGDFGRCAGARSRWVVPDPVTRAVAAIGDRSVRAIDLNDRICGPKRCAAAVGGVVVYFDDSHLTATYARTLAPYLRPALTAALDR